MIGGYVGQFLPLSGGKMSGILSLGGQKLIYDISSISSIVASSTGNVTETAFKKTLNITQTPPTTGFGYKVQTAWTLSGAIPATDLVVNRNSSAGSSSGVQLLADFQVGGAVSCVAAAADQASENNIGRGVAAFVRGGIRGQGGGGVVDVGIQALKKSGRAGAGGIVGGIDGGEGGQRPLDWRGIFSRLTGRIGLTYRQAAELTWPQLLHALGIDSTARIDESAIRIAAQDAVFDEIVARRRCLPIDLMRMPVGDLVELSKGDGNLPATGPLLASVRRYVESHGGGEGA
jgi:hypothetical protein